MCDVCVINAVKDRMLSRRDLFRRLRHVGFKRYFYGGAYHPEPRDDGDEPAG